jgi:hypothetical protein
MSYKNKYTTWYKLPNYFLVFLLLSGGLFLISCNEQARGFAFPEGDIETGKMTYKRLGCNECHSISKIDWMGGSDSLNIKLGGEVTTLKSYGELVTSVINPSHKIAGRYKLETATEDGLSKMRNYNEVMTVQELIDIVTFLQSEYEIKSPRTEYTPYKY